MSCLPVSSPYVSTIIALPPASFTIVESSVPSCVGSSCQNPRISEHLNTWASRICHFALLLLYNYDNTLYSLKQPTGTQFSAQRCAQLFQKFFHDISYPPFLSSVHFCPLYQVLFPLTTATLLFIICSFIIQKFFHFYCNIVSSFLWLYYRISNEDENVW